MVAEIGLARLGMTPTHPFKVTYAVGSTGMTRMVNYHGVDGGPAEWKSGSVQPLPPAELLKKHGPRPATTDANPFRG